MQEERTVNQMCAVLNYRPFKFSLFNNRINACGIECHRFDDRRTNPAINPKYFYLLSYLCTINEQYPNEIINTFYLFIKLTKINRTL
jgi:hypothetical protein